MLNNAATVDSLIANEFALEINGQKISGILQISGLVTYQCDAAGTRQMPPFEVAKMVERDGNNVFNTWLRETLAARHAAERPRRDVTIAAVDDGIVTRRWTAKNAWIQAVRYSPFDSGSFELVAETIVVMYDDIEESWPATT
jgi:hypothetical protein